MKREILAISAALGLAFSAASASTADAATTIFSNFASGSGYNCCGGGTISGVASSVGIYASYAEGFTSANNYSLSQLDVAVSYVTGTNGATVSLWTNNGGLLGNQLASWDLTNLSSFGSNNAPATISGITGIVLGAGQSYFVQVSAPNDTWDAWNTNSINEMGPEIFNGVAIGNGVQETFDVLGTAAVPEPSTWVLMLIGVGGVGAGLRMRRKGVMIAA